MPERFFGLVIACAIGISCGAACQHPRVWRQFPDRPPPGAPGTEAVPEGTPAGVGSSAAPALDPQCERLLTQADLVLDAIQDRSLADAARELGRLRELFPGDGRAELVEALLRRRIDRQRSSAKQPYGNPAAAKEELARAQSLGREGKLVESHLALERAHVLDPASLEIEEELVGLLKKLGLELYGKGDSTLAVSFWRRVLEIRPGDPEALRFIQRAEEVLRKA